MTDIAVRDIKRGDRLATTDRNVDAVVTHCHEAGHGVTRVPVGGDKPVPAWIIVWTWAGGYRPGQRDFDFYAPDDKVKMA